MSLMGTLSKGNETQLVIFSRAVTGPNPLHQIRHSVKHHGVEILKLQPHRVVPWAWMLITGLSTLAPLALGYAKGETAIAIFGALTGYLIGLSDHLGTLKHRLLIALIAALAAWAAFCSGIFLQNSLFGFVGLAAFVVYAIGIAGGRGAEFERLLTFATIDLFVSRYAHSLTPPSIYSITPYFAAACLTALVTIVISKFTLQKKVGEFLHMKTAIREFLSLSRERHFYALTYVTAIVGSILFVDYFKIERGYWTVITVLLMMKPSLRHTYYRMAQRVFGTLLGVSLGEIWVLSHPPMLFLIMGAGVSAAWVPYVWNKNYWLVSFCATNLVIFLLSIAQYGHVDPTLPLVRTLATIYGCLISVVVTLLFRGFRAQNEEAGQV